MRIYTQTMQDRTLGLCVCEERDKFGALSRYKETVGNLRGYQADEVVVGLIPQEGGIHTLLYSSLGEGKDQLVVMGQDETGVRSLLDDFTKYNGIIVLDLPEFYLRGISRMLTSGDVDPAVLLAEQKGIKSMEKII